MLKVKGVIPAVVTPFDDKEELNESVLRQMMKRLIRADVNGLFCLGTNGEFYAMTFDEKIRVVEIVVEEAGGLLPVYAGAGCTSTKETIALAKRFEAAGANALTIITPYFMNYSQEELIYYYARVADATSLPIVLYNMPARTMNALQPKSVLELSKIPNIIGIKDSSGSFDTLLQYLEAAAPDFYVLSGNDSLILSTLMAGGAGTISAMANILPEVVVEIYRYWSEGQYEKSEDAQRVLRAARRALKLGTQPAALKAFLNAMGIPTGSARQPICPLSPQDQKELEQIVKAYKALVINR